MTGVFGDGTLVTALPPFAPLASSGAGSSILALIQGFSTDLQSFGAPALAATLPLPGDAIGTSAIDSVLTDPLFGYDADPLGFVKYKEKLGDIELGLRWGLAQGQSMRAVLSTIVRLPTGFRDEPGNFTDIGTGDRQTDLQVGLDAAFEPGSIVSLALTGYYNLQLGDQLPRRVTSHERPIRVAAYELNVSRNLGDAYRIAAFPAVRLAPGFAAYGSIDYYHKGSDKYSFVGAPSPSSTGPAVQDLFRSRPACCIRCRTRAPEDKRRRSGASISICACSSGCSVDRKKFPWRSRRRKRRRWYRLGPDLPGLEARDQVALARLLGTRSGCLWCCRMT
jgi:hypothetical protein